MQKFSRGNWASIFYLIEHGSKNALWQSTEPFGQTPPRCFGCPIAVPGKSTARQNTSFLREVLKGISGIDRSVDITQTDAIEAG